MSTPLCTYFGKCGGCTSQHLDYSLQLQNKKQWLAKALNWNPANIVVFSDKEYFYRNRMDLFFSSQGIGLRKKDQPAKIIPVEKCVIAQEGINKLLKEVQAFFSLHPALPSLKSVILRSQENDSSACFLLDENQEKLTEAAYLVKAFAPVTSAEQVMITFSSEEAGFPQESEVLKGTGYLKEIFLKRTFFYPAQGFFQNNSVLAEKMLGYSSQMLRKYPTADAHLLDLYGGVGTFGIINSSLFKSVTIVENSSLSITAAQKNIVENNIHNARAFVLDAKQLRKITLPKPLYIITDPPRSGMDPKVIQQLRELQPEVILYISCNFHQLAKEVQKFKEYTLKSVALFDLFPHTPHLECMMELVRKNV